MSIGVIPLTVAEYIKIHIERSGKRQITIAEKCGFDKPNLITMIKQGKTKLPIAKIGLMAAALGVDPIYLFKFVMSEYAPDTWMSIEALFDQPILTNNELLIVAALREARISTLLLPASEHGPIVRAILSVVLSE